MSLTESNRKCEEQPILERENAATNSADSGIMTENNEANNSLASASLLENDQKITQRIVTTYDNIVITQTNNNVQIVINTTQNCLVKKNSKTQTEQLHPNKFQPYLDEVIHTLRICKPSIDPINQLNDPESQYVRDEVRHKIGYIHKGKEIYGTAICLQIKSENEQDINGILTGYNSNNKDFMNDSFNILKQYSYTNMIGNASLNELADWLDFDSYLSFVFIPLKFLKFEDMRKQGFPFETIERSQKSTIESNGGRKYFLCQFDEKGKCGLSKEGITLEDSENKFFKHEMKTFNKFWSAPIFNKKAKLVGLHCEYNELLQINGTNVEPIKNRIIEYTKNKSSPHNENRETQ